MAATVAADFSFTPQISQDHVSAYFRKELIFAQLAMKLFVKELPNTPGGTITFPYYGAIDAAEEPSESDKLAIDNLGDDSFTTTIFEIGKAVGRTDKSKYFHGKSPMGWEQEAHRQIGRVLAEKVEQKVLDEIGAAAESKEVGATSDITLNEAFGADKGINSTQAVAQKCNVRSISTALTDAFGDKRGEAAAVVLHSKCYNDIETDVTGGFLKADANHPLFNIKGFVGVAPSLFGLPFFVNDNVTAGTNVTISDSGSGTQDYKVANMMIFKKNPFGILVKQRPNIEYARDVRGRVDIMSATNWLAIKSFHAKISDEDLRMARRPYLINEEV